MFKKKKKLIILIALIAIVAYLFISNQGDSGAYETDQFDTGLSLIEDQLTEITGVGDVLQGVESGEEPATETPEQTVDAVPEEPQAAIDEDGWYDSKDEVALYIHTYGKLPGNYISKKEAEKLGWSGGDLDSFAPGKSIGGSHFGNYEGLLPDGHNYTECDIDTAGKSSRGAKRIVFSDDGLIYYTDDHYESFTLLYGNED